MVFDIMCFMFSRSPWYYVGDSSLVLVKIRSHFQMSTIENTEYVLNFRSFYRNLVVKSNVVDYYSI